VLTDIYYTIGYTFTLKENFGIEVFI